jgi:predicted nucleotide-binding protein (sugar kinase/HSP70/actin superfamily)
MYKINENQFKEKYILLIPSMLDAHFPLIKYAFYSKNYHPVILENEDNITEIGLRYVNNDMCYPAILNVGQMIAALQSGKYDLDKTRLLMPTAGDACRGSNYSSVLKSAVKNAGFSEVKVHSLNLKGLEKENQLKLEVGMIWRALFGLFYGDILMLLLNQTRPYEKEKGAAEKLWGKWIDILSKDLKDGKNLTLRKMKNNFLKITEDFYNLETIDVNKQRIGIVGELYIKYCHIGNWNMIRFLEENNCESHTNGLSWYAMYYMDSHMMDSKFFEKLFYKIGVKIFANIQNKMIYALKQYNFYTMETYETLKKEAKGYVSYNFNIGDGWLIGSEIVGHVLHDCEKVLAVQPFGCMPNHCCGRGLYPSLQRNLPKARITAVDVDSSGSQINAYNRVRLLIDMKFNR